MVNKIVDNVQIVIKNVYVRYEDDVSSIQNFSLGIVI